MTMRPETGPMKFGDDWRGVFIRGDDAFGFAQYLKTHILEPAAGARGGAPKVQIPAIYLAQIGTLVALLEEADERRPTDPQTTLLKDFSECVAGEIKTCDQCMQDYLAGTGTTEDPKGSRIRLSERFCSESCADEYERQMDGTDEC